MTLQTTIIVTVSLAFVIYRAARIAHTVGEKLGAMLAVVAGGAPAVWVIAARRVPSKLVVGYAVLFFVASVLLKWVVYRTIMSKYVLPRVSPAAGGTAQGILSASCELGVAGLVFAVVLTGLNVWEVFGFGAGAAAAEALTVAMMQNVHAGGLEGEHVAAQLAKMRNGPSWLQVFVPFADRCIATADHIACRGLVAAGVASRRALPIVVAFGIFAATERHSGRDANSRTTPQACARLTSSATVRFNSPRRVQKYAANSTATTHNAAPNSPATYLVRVLSIVRG